MQMNSFIIILYIKKKNIYKRVYTYSFDVNIISDNTIILNMVENFVTILKV